MTRKIRKIRRKTRRRSAPDAAASVVPAKYRERYKEHSGSSGDALSQRLRKHLATDDGSIDLAKLRALAEANDVWRDDYADLNAGLARMTCSNRLRALVRRGGKVVWPR